MESNHDEFKSVRKLIRGLCAIIRTQLLPNDLGNEKDRTHLPSAMNHIENQRSVIGFAERRLTALTGAFAVRQDEIGRLGDTFSDWRVFLDNKSDSLTNGSRICPSEVIRDMESYLVALHAHFRSIKQAYTPNMDAKVPNTAPDSGQDK